MAMRQRHEGADASHLSMDVLCLVMGHLHRFEALHAGMVCRAWRAAFTAMDAEAVKPFRPRLLVACARQGAVVDLSDLVFPLIPLTLPDIGPGQTSTFNCTAISRRQASSAGTRRVPWIALPYGKMPPGKAAGRQFPDFPRWMTSLAVCPYGDRDIFVCQYKVSGLVAFRRRSLAYHRIQVSDEASLEPEGLAFAHGCVYVQTNWGYVSRTRLSDNALLEQQEVAAPGCVTWGLTLGPPGDNALYMAADEMYNVSIYTEPPGGEASGCVIRCGLGPTGELPSSHQTTLFTRGTRLRRPSGLRFGPTCGTLFVTNMDGPCVMRFAGPLHAQPGVLLATIGPLAPAWALPWDVIATPKGQLIISMQRHKKLRAARAASGSSNTGSIANMEAGGAAGVAARNGMCVHGTQLQATRRSSRYKAAAGSQVPQAADQGQAVEEEGQHVREEVAGQKQEVQLPQDSAEAQQPPGTQPDRQQQLQEQAQPQQDVPPRDEHGPGQYKQGGQNTESSKQYKWEEEDGSGCFLCVVPDVEAWGRGECMAAASKGSGRIGSHVLPYYLGCPSTGGSQCPRIGAARGTSAEVGAGQAVGAGVGHNTGTEERWPFDTSRGVQSVHAPPGDGASGSGDGVAHALHLLPHGMRVIQLPCVLDHANMMCLDEN